MPSQWVCGTGEKDIYFSGTGGQRPNIQGNMGTKTVLGNREHYRNTILDFGGSGEPVNVFQGNKGTGTPSPPPPPPREGLDVR